MDIRKDDIVEIITGDDAGGRTGRVLRVLASEGKLVVEGVNQVHKHLKPSRQNPQGGRLLKEMPIDISNVMLYCTTCKRGTRGGRRYTAEGVKERYCKKCKNAYPGKPLGKARKAYAKK
ncbi:MAG: 50S ribosomal protein L24 [Gemmataceae bacterium]